MVDKWEVAFKEFATLLVPGEDFEEDGKQAAHSIFELLRKKSAYRLHRTCVGGSAGKDTSIILSDHDLVVFVNDEEPLFGAVLKDFERVLRRAKKKDLPYDLKIYRRSQFSIGLIYDGFKIDLLPAANYVTLTKTTSQPILGAEQALYTLQKIQKNPSNAYHYSSSLCEANVEFFDQQSDFVLDLVRLCKFWNRSLLFQEYLSGRSTLIELVAVAVGQKEEERATRAWEMVSLVSGFRNFLTSMANFEKLRIDFPCFDPLKPLRRDGVNWRPKEVGIVRSPPYVMEPANPYNDLAKNVTPSQVNDFKQFARVTIKRLDKYFQNSGPKWTGQSPAHQAGTSASRPPRHYERHRQGQGSRQGQEPFFDTIFQPQPTLIPYKTASVKKRFKKANFLVEVSAEEKRDSNDSSHDDDDGDNYSSDEDDDVPIIAPSFEIRRGAKSRYKGPGMEEALKFMQIYFAVVAQAFVASFCVHQKQSRGKKRGTLNLELLESGLRKRFEEVVDINVQGKQKAESWSDVDSDDEKNGDDHEDHDVTFDIPIEIPDGYRVTVFISLSV